MHYLTDVMCGGLLVYDVDPDSIALYWDMERVRGATCERRAFVPTQSLEILTDSPREAAAYFKQEIERGLAALNESVIRTGGGQNQIILIVKMMPVHVDPNLWWTDYGLMARKVSGHSDEELGVEKLLLGDPNRLSETWKRGIVQRMFRILFSMQGGL